MLKIVTTFIFLFIILFVGCVGNQHRKANDGEKDLRQIASPVLLGEIDNFLNGRQTNDSLRIILVNINDSFLYISPSVYYDDHGSAGYSFYQGKLVGFYFNTSDRSFNFVDTTKLLKGVAKGYLDKFPASDSTFDSLEYRYDYRLREYRIYANDSLELVLWGYW